MKYNVLDDHDTVVAVPELMIDDRPLYIGITQTGTERDSYGVRPVFAYTVATGPYEADVKYTDDDLRGPATGRWPDDSAMVATLAAFLSAYAEGELRTVPDDTDGFGTRTELHYDGDLIATGDTAEFIVSIGERLGMFASDFEEGRTMADEPAFDTYAGRDVTRIIENPDYEGEE